MTLAVPSCPRCDAPLQPCVGRSLIPCFDGWRLWWQCISDGYATSAVLLPAELLTEELRGQP